MPTLTFDELSLAITLIKDKVISIEQTLHSFNTPGKNDSQSDFFTVKEAAEFLHISTSTIYRLVNNRSLPFHKQGRRLYFFKRELINWIEGNKSVNLQKIEADAESIFLTNQKRKRRSF
jgi:excisionase family DNA binding protein